jgi:hypothetical protein
MLGAAQGGRSRRRRWWPAARRVVLGFSCLFFGYAALVMHPEPLFAHSAQRGNLVLHARQPLPAEATAMLEDALGRVRRSPLFDAARVHHVFVCDTPALFALFTLWDRNAGGVTATWATSNVFIRPTNLQRGRVIGASGVEKGGERTLAYYVAHEVTHAMTTDRIGRLASYELAAFQREGCADYVAFLSPMDLAQGRRDLLANTKDMDPQRSGHYDRYRLLVGYLLEQRHLSVDELLRKPLDRRSVEAELGGAQLSAQP